MAWFVAGGMAVMSAYSANQAASAGNKAASAAQENAARRYEMEGNVAKNQMEEQQVIARDKMTDVTRAFVQAKGKATAIQAETGVTGASADRIAANQRSKFSEATGKVAQEVDTNVINIAQGMLGKKVDTDAIVAEAESKKKNVFTATAMGALEGGMKGYSMGASMGGGKPGGDVGVKDVGGDTLYEGGASGWNDSSMSSSEILANFNR